MTNKTKKPEKRYQIGMIRDFIEQLKWEARIQHFESTSAIGTLNEELAEQLTPFYKKYKSPLLFNTAIDPDGLSDKEIAQARAKYSDSRAEYLNGCIESLESLSEFFEEAFATGAKRGICTRVISAKELLAADDDDASE